MYQWNVNSESFLEILKSLYREKTNISKVIIITDIYSEVLNVLRMVKNTIAMVLLIKYIIIYLKCVIVSKIMLISSFTCSFHVTSQHNRSKYLKLRKINCEISVSKHYSLIKKAHVVLFIQETSRGSLHAGGCEVPKNWGSRKILFNKHF